MPTMNAGQKAKVKQMQDALGISKNEKLLQEIMMKTRWYVIFVVLEIIV